MKVVFFKSAAEFRRWLGKNHASASELWVGFYRKHSGKRGISYQEALDEALCHGWIDGVRKKVDETSYTNRFSPRTPRSIWSRINIARVAELKREGRMKAPGLAAFEAREAKRSGVYSFERPQTLSPEYDRRLRADAKCWAFFERQAPWYRRVISHWVMSAVKEETRLKRLEKLIEDCRKGRFVGAVPGKSPR